MTTQSVSTGSHSASHAAAVAAGLASTRTPAHRPQPRFPQPMQPPAGLTRHELRQIVLDILG